ncbi:MAG: hypothetical protein PF961_03915, partial [Planctomycetota bacterium]|nr:hypothetical protein [Planctomycetota bacterium]
LGLAAAAADRPGPAAAWLLEAHRRAPGASEPVQALRVLGAEIPSTWSASLGPLAAPGASLAGPLLLALGAALAAFALCAPQRRLNWLILAGALLLLALPGQLARQVDARHTLVAVVTPSHLLDATGAPIPGGAVTPGTVLTQHAHAAWNGRMRTTRADGLSGWLPVADTEARP